MSRKTGDIIRVFYPFTPRAKNQENSNEGKERFGVIINNGNNMAVAIPIMQITSHGKRTEHPDYRLRLDEVRVPAETSYFKPTQQKRIPIYGVIKTERIELFDDDEISGSLTNIGKEGKIQILEKYKELTSNRHYLQRLNEESPGHKEAMETFERFVIGEKLRFLEKNGESNYEKMEDRSLEINKIQHLGKANENKRIHFYAVELTDKEGSFFYTIASKKQPKQVVKEWGKPKTAKEWIQTDERYYQLKKDIRQKLEPTPEPKEEKYRDFKVFRRNILKQEQQRER